MLVRKNFILRRRLELHGAQSAAQDEVAQRPVVHKRRLGLLEIQLGAQGTRGCSVAFRGVFGSRSQSVGQQRGAGDRPADPLEGGRTDEARRFADEERVVVPEAELPRPLRPQHGAGFRANRCAHCLLYTSDAADD